MILESVDLEILVLDYAYYSIVIDHSAQSLPVFDWISIRDLFFKVIWRYSLTCQGIVCMEDSYYDCQIILLLFYLHLLWNVRSWISTFSCSSSI